jgi:hypothetical protein
MPQGVEGLAQFGQEGLNIAKGLRDERMAMLDEERKKLEYATQRLASATPETYLAIRADLGRISPQFANALPAEYSSEQIGSIVRQGLALKDQLDLFKPMTVAPNTTVFNPRTGQAMYTAPAAPRESKLLTPEEEAQQARLRPPAQPREPAAPTVTQIQDPTNPNQMLTVDARRYQGGGLGSSGVIGTSGKPAPIAAAELKREEGKTQLQTDLDNLRSAFTELNRRRAIPSTERGGISNLASSAQASGLGQAAGRAFGTKEQVERDVINSARQRLVASIKNATGMSSKSLDSNLELQTMLRSLSDPSQAFETAIRIIDDIEDIYVRGAGAKNEPSAPRPPAPGAGGGGFPAPPAAAIDALKRGMGTDAQFDAMFGPGAAARARGR